MRIRMHAPGPTTPSCPPSFPHDALTQVEERSASGEGALQLAALLSHAHSHERARTILERCMRELQQAGGAAGTNALMSAAAAGAGAAAGGKDQQLAARLQALLGWVVLAQQLAEPEGQRDEVEVATAGGLFEAALAREPGNLEVRGRDN
jgi:hypothetical protein